MLQTLLTARFTKNCSRCGLVKPGIRLYPVCTATWEVTLCKCSPISAIVIKCIFLCADAAVCDAAVRQLRSNFMEPPVAVRAAGRNRRCAVFMYCAIPNVPLQFSYCVRDNIAHPTVAGPGNCASAVGAATPSSQLSCGPTTSGIISSSSKASKRRL